MPVFHQLSKPSNDALTSRGARGERQELMGRPHLGSQGPCPNISSNCREAPGNAHYTVKRDTGLLRTRVQAEPTRKQGNSLKITTDIGPLGWSLNFFTGKE